MLLLVAAKARVLRRKRSHSKYDVWISSSFHKLVERGFRLDAKDIILLDESREPGLVDWLPPPGGHNDNDDDDGGGNGGGNGGGGGDNNDDMED